MNSPLAKNPVIAPSVSVEEEEAIEDFDDDFDPNSGWLLLLYGKFGSGKTWFCGTARNSLYINTGSGEDTLKSPLFKSKHPDITRKVKTIINTPKKLGFDQVCDVVGTVLNNETLLSEIKTITIDDATSLRSMAMLHGMKSMGKNIKKYIDSDMSDIKREMNRMTWFIEHHLPIFKAKGINFILTAHESRIYGKASKMGEERPLKEIRPGFSGEKFPDAIPSKFDEVWYIELKSGKNGEYSQIKTGGGGVEITRTRRAGVFENYILNKDFEQLLEQRKDNKLHPSFRRN